MSGTKSSFKRSAVICVAAVLVLGGGGAAFAYWSSTGSGTGSATTGTSAVFGVTSSGRTGDALVPDGEPQTVAFTVANPSTGTLNLVTVVVTVANSDGSEWIDVDGCSAADYLVDNLIVGYGIVAGGSDVDGTVDVAMIDTGVNQDACKGVQVPLYFAAS